MGSRRGGPSPFPTQRAHRRHRMPRWNTPDDCRSEPARGLAPPHGTAPLGCRDSREQVVAFVTLAAYDRHPIRARGPIVSVLIRFSPPALTAEQYDKVVARL